MFLLDVLLRHFKPLRSFKKLFRNSPAKLLWASVSLDGSLPMALTFLRFGVVPFDYCVIEFSKLCSVNGVALLHYLNRHACSAVHICALRWPADGCILSITWHQANIYIAKESLFNSVTQANIKFDLKKKKAEDYKGIMKLEE